MAVFTVFEMLLFDEGGLWLLALCFGWLFLLFVQSMDDFMVLMLNIYE